MRGVKVHQFHRRHFLLLIQWLEFDLRRWPGVIGHHSIGHRVEIVGANGNQSSLAANVHVQFVLQIDETVVRVLVEGDVPQHSRNHMGTNLDRVLFDMDLDVASRTVDGSEFRGFDSGRGEIVVDLLLYKKKMDFYFSWKTSRAETSPSRHRRS